MDSLIARAESFVTALFSEKLAPTFVYHNLTHTQRVVAKTKELIEGMEIKTTDAKSLTLAALFHDVGYTKNIDNHEDISVAIARDFLEEHKATQSLINDVTTLILSTKLEYQPKNELEKIIRDADTAHIGSQNFEDLTELLHKECELTQNKQLSDIDWNKTNIDFLTHKHKFYTHFATSKWGEAKQNNITKLLKKQKKLAEKADKLKQKNTELTLKKNKVALPERGVETVFRVALRNHMALSDIADTKANILLSVNAIIVSLSLSSLLPKLDNPSNHYLIIPAIIFIVFTLISMVLSVLATRPNVSGGKFSKKEVKAQKVNLLFFGNFHKMQLDQFEWAMKEMMKSKDYLYSSLTKDLYFLGKVLHKKYTILRITYLVFIIGIVVSVIAFALAFKAQGG